MTRNKHFRSVFAALLCAVLCMTAFATVAYADGGDYYDDELPPETWQEETQPEDNTIVPGTPFTEDGIAEQGSHEELIAKGRIYKELYSMYSDMR